MSLKYKIALINVFWEEEDIDTRFFESVQSQTDYFEMKASGKYSTLSNFPVNNNIDTKIVYKDTTGRDIRELVASNYAVVKRFDDETNEVLEYRYYFAYCKQDSGTQIAVTLSLDDIQTNYFKYKDNINKCTIKRAHLERFDNVEGDLYKFKGKPNSNLFERENFGELPKRLTKRYELGLNYDKTSNSKLNKWLKENIVAWNYIYIQSNRSYNVFDPGTQAQILYPAPSVRYSNDLIGTGTLLCVPILKNEYKTIPATENSVERTIRFTSMIFEVDADTEREIADVYICNEGLDRFRQYNNDTSFYFSNKLSLKAPFNIDEFVEGVDYDFVSNKDGDDVNHLIIYNSKQNVGKVFGGDVLTTWGQYREGVLCITKDIDDIESETINLDKNFIFNKNDIINSYKDVKFNPKLLSSDYIEINVTNGAGESFTYDLQKINDNTFNFKYNESITMDVSKTYTRLNNFNGLYDENTLKSYLGLLVSNDMSLPYDNGQLQNMLANNKNFFLQSNINMAIDAGKNIVGSTIQGGWAGLAKGVATSGVNVAQNIINRNLTIDNLRNAPSQLKNANGNAIFSSNVTDIKIYVEIYECLNHEKESANDYMYQYGFEYGKLGYLSDFDNIRYYFNYIEASLNVIDAPISLDEKRRLKDIFNRGVRFWNSDTIQYDMENYERMLITNE